MPPAACPDPSGTAPDRLRALADRCVQCGLCLPACPTYRVDQIEAESPRGRIALARAWADETIPPTRIADRHLDQCLGCRNCETVCPAGVNYGELLVEARAIQRERRPAGWQQRGVEWLSARPPLLNGLLQLYRRLHRWLPGGLRFLPKPPHPTHHPPIPLTEGDSVALFIGCLGRPYEAGLRDAVARLCAATGTVIRIPAAQTCCGTLHVHAGNLRQRDRPAAANRAAFAGGTVLTLASGCHEALAAALGDTAHTRDAIDYLHDRAAMLQFRERRERVALHLPCTQRNVTRSVAALRALLARVPGLTVIELTAGLGCCGAAGTRMLFDPEGAAAYRQPLLDQFRQSGASRLLSANIGCRLHFANATEAEVQHPLEFLAELLPGMAAPAEYESAAQR